MEDKTLVLDLFGWISPGPKGYDEVIVAWRTSCPRLAIRDDALDAGRVAVSSRKVVLAAAGRRCVARKRYSNGG